MARPSGGAEPPVSVGRAAAASSKLRRASWEVDLVRTRSSSSSSRRTTVARSWYGGYGALAEEEEDEDSGPGGSLTDVAARGHRDLVMPSLKNLVSMATLSRRRSSSTTALNTVPTQRTLPTAAKSVTALPLLRKCETSVTLVRPVNRLRMSTTRMCSRCSSILSMASSSRYSINTAGGFVPVASEQAVLCKLCLNEVPRHLTYTLDQCACTFCVEVSLCPTFGDYMLHSVYIAYH